MDVVYGLNPSVRPLIIGSLTSLILFVVNVSLAMRYFRYALHFDGRVHVVGRRVIRLYTDKNKATYALAIWVLFLEFGHTVILCCMIGKTGVANIQDTRLGLVRHYHQYSGIITSFTTFTTQLYFTWRFYEICGYTRFSVMAALCTVAKTAGYCTSAMRFLLHPNSIASWIRWLWVGVSIFSMSTHAIISGGLYIFYRSESARMLLGPMRIRVDRVILRCMQADVIPSLFILAITITYMKGVYSAWVFMTVITGRLFTLSLFTSLLSTKDYPQEEPTIADLPSLGPASIYNGTIESESAQTEISMVPIAKTISVDITIEATVVSNTS